MRLSPARQFDALVIQSPASCSGETKDQDRACWCASTHTAVVCDGVSNSDFSREAAELVSSGAAVLFQGDSWERLAYLANLLMAQRLEALSASNFNTPATACGSLLEQVARERLAAAYQTTLVAAGFVAGDDCVIADIARCGDSAFLAFSPAGEILDSSPSITETRVTPASNVTSSRSLRFGPHQEILVRVLGPADQMPLWVEPHVGSLRGKNNWFLCAPLTKLTGMGGGAAHQDGAITVTVDDHLLVPAHLLGQRVPVPGERMHIVRYSGSIRVISRAPGISQPGLFERKGSVTDVLPDGFPARRWILWQDRFPPDTQYLLASDGFYGAFDNAVDLWRWLSTNQMALADAGRREGVLTKLHSKLHGKRGDDDISFVWVRPTDSPDATPSRPK